MTMWEGFALSRLAIVLIDQLRQIYIEGELELIDTTRYYPKIIWTLPWREMDSNHRSPAEFGNFDVSRTGSRSP
jgi:hypothetical protein